MVTTDDGKHGRCPRVAIDHAIGVERQANRERMAAFPGDPCDRRVKTAGVLVPDRHAIANLKPFRVLERYLLFSVVAIQCQYRSVRPRFAQNGLRSLTA